MIYWAGMIMQRVIMAAFVLPALVCGSRNSGQDGGSAYAVESAPVAAAQQIAPRMEEPRTRLPDTGELRATLHELQGRAWAGDAAALKELRAMLKTHAEHPIRPSILISLGMLAERDDPKAALDWYMKVLAPSEGGTYFGGEDQAIMRIFKLGTQTPALRKKILERVGRFVNAPPGKTSAPALLLALGDWTLPWDEEKAMSYYQAAARHPMKMNPWGYEQQTAIQRIAALYEKQGKYPEAVKTLAGWEVREQCGTGAAGTEVTRQMKMLELRLHYEDEATVLADLWKAAVGGLPWTTGGDAEWMAYEIRRLYGPKRSDALKKHVAEARNRLTTQASSGQDPLRADKGAAMLMAAVQEQLAFVETVAQALPETLASLLEKQILSRGPPLPQEIRALAEDIRTDPFVTHKFWRDFAILDAIVRYGPKAAPALIALNERFPGNDLLVLAIRKAGGPQAEHYLRSAGARF